MAASYPNPTNDMNAFKILIPDWYGTELAIIAVTDLKQNINSLQIFVYSVLKKKVYIKFFYYNLFTTILYTTKRRYSYERETEVRWYWQTW
jgi:hypothetical protein